MEPERLTQLKDSFTFYLCSADRSEVAEMLTFGTAEEFWGVYQHMRRPTSLPPGAAFFLYRKGELPGKQSAGPENLELRLKQSAKTNKVWEDMQLLLLTSDERLRNVRGASVHSLVGGTSVEVALKPQSQREVDELAAYLRDALELGNDAHIGPKESPRKDSWESEEAVREARAEGALKRLSVNEQAKFEGLSALRENRQLRHLIEDIDKGH